MKNSRLRLWEMINPNVTAANSFLHDPTAHHARLKALTFLEFHLSPPLAYSKDKIFHFCFRAMENVQN